MKNLGQFLWWTNALLGKQVLTRTFQDKEKIWSDYDKP